MYMTKNIFSIALFSLSLYDIFYSGLADKTVETVADFQRTCSYPLLIQRVLFNDDSHTEIVVSRASYELIRSIDY